MKITKRFKKSIVGGLIVLSLAFGGANALTTLQAGNTPSVVAAGSGTGKGGDVPVVPGLVSGDEMGLLRKGSFDITE